MIRYPRPPVPAGFPTAAVKKAAATVRAARGVSVDFPNLWADYKHHFVHAQEWKCGFCETSTRGSYGGDVEHYAPKAEVGALKSPGMEVEPWSESITGRRCPPCHTTGYWWRAYAWDNWLLSCHVCNRGWKQTLFPVLESPHPFPDEATAFTPLLLHPLETEDPLDHLDFDASGLIWSLTHRGLATLSTCGLDRPSLIDVRRGVGAEAEKLCKRLQSASTLERKAEALGDLCDLGADDHPYAGTVRAIARQHFALSWEKMVNWRQDTDSQLRGPR